MYSVEETKTPNGYYCKIVLPAHCTFVNEHPSDTPFNAMISATSLAVGAILEACFKLDQEPDSEIVKERKQNSIIPVMEENTLMTEATAKRSTPPPAIAPATPSSLPPTNGRSAPAEVAPPSSKKRKIEKIEEVGSDSELIISEGGTFMERLIGEGPDGQHLVDRTHATMNLTEFSSRGLFAAITSSMKWIAHSTNKKTDDNQVESTMMVDPKDGHLPWMVCEVRPSEKLAREATIRRFLQLLTDEGIIRVNPMLPRIEDMKDYASAQRVSNASPTTIK
ncbi:unnamed protein product [Umbelopsis ramanniana]